MLSVKKITYIMIVIIMSLGQGFASTAPASPVSSDIINNDGQKIGTVQITPANHVKNQGVILNIQAQNLPAGKHGMHFHSVGDCSGLHDFKTSGGHIMPTNKPHGFLHPQGPHEGNLPNLIAFKDGTAHVELYSNLVDFTGKNAHSLNDKDGSALIIHANPDDHITQPIGGAGDRIACAVIK